MPNFRHRLTKSQQKVYDQSNAFGSIPVRVSPRLARAVQLLPVPLDSDSDALRSRRVGKVAQVIVDELCSVLRVPTLPVSVLGKRPIRSGSEYHGLYESTGRSHRISVWMYTAKRRQVVAPKTFLRTLLHEVCHHLDYTRLGLDDSFHTDGFFKRESSLVHQLMRAAEAHPSPRDTPTPERRAELK
jgi:hypothetical protein